MLIIKELKQALAAKQYFMCLTTALIIPDICGAAESTNGLASKANYKAWFDKYVAHKYPGKPHISSDIYVIRCALLHQGKVNHPNSNYSRIVFQIPDGTGLIIHNNIMNDALNLSVEAFCKEIIEGYEKWEKDTAANGDVQNRLKEGITYYPNGLAPYIVGAPLFA